MPEQEGGKVLDKRLLKELYPGQAVGSLSSIKAVGAGLVKVRSCTF